MGSLITACLLAEEHSRLILPVRPKHKPENVLAKIVGELEASDYPVTQQHLDRLTILPLTPTSEMLGLRDTLRALGVDEIIHAAGCVDYFNTHNLNLGNLELTRAWIELGHALRVRRFHFISTAFCSGYRDGCIPETLHPDICDDPTAYARSKRDTEALIAGSGLPYLIVRPSVVGGDSKNGHYGGKRYGVYQLWHAAERFLCAEYLERIYAYVPRSRLYLIHQDAFQAGFLAAYRSLVPPAVFHLVSRESELPWVRDLWDLWLETCARPKEVHYYDRLDAVPMEQLSRQQQLLLEFASVNVDIGAHPWHFETTTLDGLRANGLQFADTTVKTLRICQDRFIAESPRVQAFMEKYRSKMRP
jgi:thioester reductase-like protein